MGMSMRLIKVRRDFSLRWGRTTLAFLGLAVGLFGAGVVLAAFSLLRTDLEANYRGTNPPNLVVRVDRATPQVLARLAALPGITAVEERPVLMARAQVGADRWMPLELSVVDDFDHLRIATFQPGPGLDPAHWLPPPGEMLIERDGAAFLAGSPQGALPLRFADGGGVTAQVAGYAFDPGQHPSRMEMRLYGYVTRATFAAWQAAGAPVLDGTRLLLTTRAATGPESATALAPGVEAALAQAGVTVRRLDAWDVPRHGHQNQLDALLALMGALAAVSLAMGTVLVVNLIDGIMTRERRTIGILRALGADRGMLVRDHLLAAGALGLLAALASLWPALRLGVVIARSIAGRHNFDLLTPAPPWWVAAAVLAFGVAVPGLTAAWGVGRAARPPVRQALARGGGVSLRPWVETVARMLGRLPPLPRLAIGGILRRPRPAVLSALVLALGLAFFLTALNVRASMQGTAAAVLRGRPYDLTVDLAQPYPIDRLRTLLADRPEVAAAEYWTALPGTLATAEGGRLGNPVSVVVPPDGTRLLRPDILAGRWLDPSLPDGVVVTQKLLADLPAVRLGGHYRLSLAGGAVPVTVVGVVREFGPARVYVPPRLVPGLAEGGEQTCCC